MEQKKVREREGHKSGYSISEKEDERKTLKLSSEMKARPTFNCKSWTKEKQRRTLEGDSEDWMTVKTKKESIDLEVWR
jgi:hypothetical protein